MAAAGGGEGTDKAKTTRDRTCKAIVRACYTGAKIEIPDLTEIYENIDHFQLATPERPADISSVSFDFLLSLSSLKRLEIYCNSPPPVAILEVLPSILTNPSFRELTIVCLGSRVCWSESDTKNLLDVILTAAKANKQFTRCTCRGFLYEELALEALDPLCAQISRNLFLYTIQTESTRLVRSLPLPDKSCSTSVPAAMTSTTPTASTTGTSTPTATVNQERPPRIVWCDPRVGCKGEALGRYDYALKYIRIESERLFKALLPKRDDDAIKATQAQLKDLDQLFGALWDELNALEREGKTEHKLVGFTGKFLEKLFRVIKTQLQLCISRPESPAAGSDAMVFAAVGAGESTETIKDEGADLFVKHPWLILLTFALKALEEFSATPLLLSAALKIPSTMEMLKQILAQVPTLFSQVRSAQYQQLIVEGLQPRNSLVQLVPKKGTHVTLSEVYTKWHEIIKQVTAAMEASRAEIEAEAAVSPSA